MVVLEICINLLILVRMKTKIIHLKMDIHSIQKISIN